MFNGLRLTDLFYFKDDNLLLRFVNDTNRSIYAFELSDPPDAFTSFPDGGNDRVAETEPCQNGINTGEEIGPCTICLDDLDADLKRHSGNSCNFIACDSCLEVRFLFFICLFFLLPGLVTPKSSEMNYAVYHESQRNE